MNQKKIGIILSYITLLINTIISILLTPFLIKSLGKSEYGIYQLVHSFTGYLIILNFGTGVAVARFVSMFRVNNEKEKQENFLSLAFIVTLLLSVVIGVIGFILFFSIDLLFSKSLLVNELILAKELYILMVVNLAITLFSNTFSGIIIGYEKFAFSNGLKLIRIILRVVIILLLIDLGYKSLSIVFADLLLTVFMIFFEALYVFLKLRIKVKYHYFDSALLKLLFSFSIAMLLQSIVNQINQSIDKVILGSMMGSEIVTLYSIALVFFMTFSNLTSVIGNVFLPQASRYIAKNASSEELTNLVIKPGRFQFMIGGAVIGGFILYGKQFIILWVGSDFLGAYLPALLLMIPMMIPLIQNVCVSIIDAMMKRMFRSLVLVFVALTNVVLTLLLVKNYGYVGAAIGTALAITLGEIIIMNIYYSRILKLNINRMFYEIFDRTLFTLILTVLINLPINLIISKSPFGLMIKIIIFLVIYAILLFLIAMHDYEKNIFIKPIKKLFNRFSPKYNNK